MTAFWQDIRFASRLIVQKPGFAIIVVLVLGLGIGVNSAVFSLLHTALWRPLDLEDPERLVVLASTSPDGPSYDGLSYLDYEDYASRTDVLAGLALHFPLSLNVRLDDRQEIAWGAVTTVDYFAMLGVRAARGRTFVPEEDGPQGAHPVVVLGDAFWQSRLGGDPEIVGREISLNGTPYTVIGVAPPGFRGNHALLSYDFWVPISMAEELFPGASATLEDRKQRNLFAMGRLQEGVSLDEARLRLSDHARVLAKEYPDANEGIGIGVYPEAYGRLGMGSGPILRLGSTVILALVSLVLLIACVNVANLLLARSAARRREIGVRLALGASRGRLVRQLLTESVLLALLGGLVGLGLAVWTGYLLAALPTGGGLPLVFDYALDSEILLYTLLVTLATGVVFGLGPALGSSRGNLVGALRSEGGAQGSPGRGWKMRKILVVAQVAASLVILVSAGLFARSLQNVVRADVGFEPRERLRASFNLSLHGYDAARSRQFFDQLHERIRHLPGVISATWATPMPLDTFGLPGFLYIEGAENTQGENEPVRALLSHVGPTYFETMGTPVIEGRPLGEQDREGQPRVAVINRLLAERYWPDGDAVGSRFRFGEADGPWIEVVGVAANGKYRTIAEPPFPFLFLPRHQAATPPDRGSLIVHSTLSPSSLGEQIRTATRELDDQVMPLDVTTLESHLSRTAFMPARAIAALVSLFGLLGFGLALIGLYGLLTYSVSRQTQEIGVRMALGATRSGILKMVLGSGLRLSLMGVAVGLLLSLAASRVLSGLLYEVDSLDGVTFVLLPIAVVMVALLSCWLPARRATRIDPLTALRYE